MLPKPQNALTTTTVDNLAIFAEGIEMNQFRFYFSNFVDIYNMTSNIGMETIYFSNSQLSCFYFCWAFCLLCRVTLEQVWVMDPSLP